jgi:hypothetical protein
VVVSTHAHRKQHLTSAQLIALGLQFSLRGKRNTNIHNVEFVVRFSIFSLRGQQ